MSRLFGSLPSFLPTTVEMALSELDLGELSTLDAAPEHSTSVAYNVSVVARPVFEVFSMSLFMQGLRRLASELPYDIIDFGPFSSTLYLTSWEKARCPRPWQCLSSTRGSFQPASPNPVSRCQNSINRRPHASYVAHVLKVSTRP
jgi:hypothetical protein